MVFTTAVTNTPEVTSCLQPGLRALGSDSKRVKVAITSLCDGSIDLDTCLSQQYLQNNRRDYCFAYNGEVYFVEVHSAITSEVTTVIRKLTWLKSWLQNNAPEIDKLKAQSRTPYYWVQNHPNLAYYLNQNSTEQSFRQE